MTTRIAQVKDYNALVDVHNMGAPAYFTVGTGSMLEKLRVKGWVIFQSPKMGDRRDFAKWFPNEAEARLELAERI